MAGCATSASDATTYSADDEKPRVTGSRIPIKDNSVANTKTMDKQSIDGMMRRGVTSAGGSN